MYTTSFNRLYQIFFIILCLNLGIHVNCDGQTNDKHLELKKIEAFKTDKHQRVKGSKVYLEIPDEYIYSKELSRFQKRPKLYFQIFELEASFEEAKPNFTREAFEAKGAKVTYFEKIKVGTYDGIYSEGPSKFDGETKIGITFGDDEFIVMLVGVYEDIDTEGRLELLNIMKTVFYQKSFKTDPLELANFDVDLARFGFKLNATHSNTYIFTPNGKEDGNTDDVTSVSIAVMPQMSTVSAAGFVENIIGRFGLQGFKLESTELENTMINNYPSYVLKTIIEKDGKKGFMYFSMILGETGSLLFVGMEPENHEDANNRFEQIVQTIKFKKS